MVKSSSKFAKIFELSMIKLGGNLYKKLQRIMEQLIIIPHLVRVVSYDLEKRIITMNEKKLNRMFKHVFVMYIPGT